MLTAQGVPGKSDHLVSNKLLFIKHKFVNDEQKIPLTEVSP